MSLLVAWGVTNRILIISYERGTQREGDPKGGGPKGRGTQREGDPKGGGLKGRGTQREGDPKTL